MLFDLASKFSALCRTSEQNGRGDGGREEGEDKQPHIPLRLGFGILPGVCGKSAGLFSVTTISRILGWPSGTSE